MAFKALSLMLLAFASLFTLAGAQPTQAAHNSRSADWDPACYRTNAQIETFLQGIAASYPQLATLTDAGPSWEGRPQWLVQLGSNRLPGPKPTLFLAAAHHARDIAGPEVLLRFVAYLTQNYGIDPDVTWLLDNRRVAFLPVINPDGYFRVYSAPAPLWYKNANNNYCPNSTNRGADVNLNYPFHWNQGGTSTLQCDSSYPGPSALSEPESQHVLSAVQGSGADLVISLQAPGPAIHYPWGWSSTLPPDAAGLDALGWNLGRLNGTPRSAVRTHNANSLTSGILDDTLYGQYGIAAYTFNIGNTFAPACGATLDEIWQAQRPAFVYAVKAVGSTLASTLSRPFGPTPSSIAVAPASAPGNIEVTGVLSSNYGLVSGAVYSIDEPGEDGSGVPMSGNFGGSIADVSATVDTSGLTNGRHLLLVQGRNDTGHWGVFSSAFFTVTGSVITPVPTNTPSATTTVVSTATSSPTSLPSPTNTVSHTATRSPTITPISSTRTPTTTPFSETRTATPSRTPTSDTATPTGTPQPTGTRTPTSTRTLTPTRTATFTRIPTLTRTPTYTRTPTLTRTSTSTRTPTRTRTAIATYTGAPTRTPGPPNTATPLPCANYSDVYITHFFYRAVDWLTCHNLISGYPDNTFRPYNPATRAQIVKIVVLGEGWTLLAPPEPAFSDVAPADWFYEVVSTAVGKGVIGGYADGTFRPNNNVTRGQLSKIITLARRWPLLDPLEPHFSDVERGSTFYSFIETAQYHGIVSGYGDGTFRANANATRGQLAKMLYVALTQASGP